MPYEHPFIHKTPNEHSAEPNTSRAHQPSSPLNRILLVVGFVGFIVVIIAGYFWWK